MRNQDCAFLTRNPHATAAARLRASVNRDGTVKAVSGLQQVRLHVLSVGVGAQRTRGTSASVQAQLRRTSDSTFAFNHEADQMWTWYRPLTSPRHVNFQRCVFQTKLEGGMWAECAAAALGNVARARLSNLRTITNNTTTTKKKNVAARSGPTGECAAAHAASGAQSFGCAAPWETCAESLTVLPAAAQQHFQQRTCAFSATLLPVSAFSSFVLREKSLGDDAEAQQPLSCSFVPTRTCQLINCASRLCAAPQLLCPISARLLLYRL